MESLKKTTCLRICQLGAGGNPARNAQLSGLEKVTRAQSGIPAQNQNLAERKKRLPTSPPTKAGYYSVAIRVEQENSEAQGVYEARKGARKNGMFLIYIAAMFLWHICHGMNQYRALKFDEKHPDGEVDDRDFQNNRERDE